MLDIASINDCLAFLNRTPLRGDEVPAFTNIVHRLQLLRDHLQQQATPGPAPAELTDKPRHRRKARPVPIPNT